MGKVSMNLQDSFLNQVRKDGGKVRVIMLDGAEMIGQVRGFDNFTLIIFSEGAQSLVYKHAIARMVALRTANRQAKNAPVQAGDKDKSAKKKPGFNTLDLSQIKIADNQSAEKQA